MEYGNHKKHSAGARNVKARAKRALLLPSNNNNGGCGSLPLADRVVKRRKDKKPKAKGDILM